jgi:hypothetical protein
MAPTPTFPNEFQSFIQDIHHRTPIQTQNVTSNATSYATTSDTGGGRINLIMIGAILCIGLIVIIAAGRVATSSCCSNRSSRSRNGNSSLSRQETRLTATAAQARRSNCRKSQNSRLSSRRGSPENIPLGQRARNGAQRQTSTRQSENHTRGPSRLALPSDSSILNVLREEPPEYQPAGPTQPQSVYLNTVQNVSRMTFNSVETATTLPAYHQSHQDQFYVFPEETDSAPAPVYT